MKFVFYVKSPIPSINKYQEQSLHALTLFIFYKQAPLKKGKSILPCQHYVTFWQRFSLCFNWLFWFRFFFYLGLIWFLLDLDIFFGPAAVFFCKVN